MNNFYETILTSPAERIYDVVCLENGTMMYRFQLSDALDLLDATAEMKHLLMLKRAFDRREDIVLDEPTDENERKYDLALARYVTAKEMCKLEFGYNAVIDALNVAESKEMASK